MLNWIKNHFNTLHQLQLNATMTDLQGANLSLEAGFQYYIDQVKRVRNTDNKIIFMGNGGSAGIASHLAIDYSKNGCMPSLAFSDASALTCLSNDYGYDQVFAKQIEYHARKHDVLIVISSSGKSVNILNAVDAARKKACRVMTFSGFDANNPLRKLGDLNIFVASAEYGFVEMAHMALGHTMLDYMIEEMQAEAKPQPLVANE